MKYNVKVEEKYTGKSRELVIGIERIAILQINQQDQQGQDENKEQQEDEQQKAGVETSPEICLELSKAEYEHSIRRSEKLDNKIYILLTVCGFIFVMLVNAIANIEDIEVLNFGISRWIIAYDVLLIVTSISTMILLGRLIYCLSGIELKRYDSNLTYEMHLTSLDKTQVARFAIFEYEIAKKHNNDLISKRFDKVNLSVKLLIGVVVLLMLLSVAGSFSKIATAKYRATADSNQERSIDDVLDEIERDAEYIREYLRQKEQSKSENDDIQFNEAETRTESVGVENKESENGSE